MCDIFYCKYLHWCDFFWCNIAWYAVTMVKGFNSSKSATWTEGSANPLCNIRFCNIRFAWKVNEKPLHTLWRPCMRVFEFVVWNREQSSLLFVLFQCRQIRYFCCSIQSYRNSSQNFHCFISNWMYSAKCNFENAAFYLVFKSISLNAEVLSHRRQNLFLKSTLFTIKRSVFFVSLPHGFWGTLTPMVRFDVISTHMSVPKRFVAIRQILEVKQLLTITLSTLVIIIWFSFK